MPTWEKGWLQPTLHSLEVYARRPCIGRLDVYYEAAGGRIPLANFRAIAELRVIGPSSKLLVIGACQNRQIWYRGHVFDAGEPVLDVVDSIAVTDAAESFAAAMRTRLEFNLAFRRECSSRADVKRMRVCKVDQAGVLVMVRGIVLSSNRRVINLEEARGFALSDPCAPLSFVNERDTMASQTFTIAHELAHTWRWFFALSNASAAAGPGCRAEDVWCSVVAAEFLVP